MVQGFGQAIGAPDLGDRGARQNGMTQRVTPGAQPVAQKAASTVPATRAIMRPGLANTPPKSGAHPPDRPSSRLLAKALASAPASAPSPGLPAAMPDPRKQHRVRQPIRRFGPKATRPVPPARPQTRPDHRQRCTAAAQNRPPPPASGTVTGNLNRREAPLHRQGGKYGHQGRPRACHRAPNWDARAARHDTVSLSTGACRMQSQAWRRKRR